MQPAYPPHVLRDYAFIADGRRGALIGPRGDITWLCAPRWDSPAVISHLIGGDGIYAITPTDPYVWGGYYEPGSLIWCSRWVTTDASSNAARRSPTRAIHTAPSFCAASSPATSPRASTSPCA